MLSLSRPLSFTLRRAPMAASSASARRPQPDFGVVTR